MKSSLCHTGAPQLWFRWIGQRLRQHHGCRGRYALLGFHTGVMNGMALASWDRGCLGPLYPGTLSAEDLVVPGGQNRAWGYGPEGPSPPLL